MDKKETNYLKKKWELAEQATKDSVSYALIVALILIADLIMIVSIRLDQITWYSWTGVWGLMIIVALLLLDSNRKQKEAKAIYELFLELELKDVKKT